MTIQRRVWEYLKANGPKTAPEVSKALSLKAYDDNHPAGQASICLRRLVQRKKAKIVEGAGKRHRLYQAIGKLPPEDKRGTHPNSRANLNEFRSANAAKFHARRGHNPRPVATHALDQAWGWLPRTSPVLSAKNECDSIVGGTVRPQEPEAA